jgi:peptidoglycan/xylan/chitin deacetylase (PgdA/CDA1 family)
MRWKAILPLFGWTGLLRLYRFRLRNTITILMLHGVMDMGVSTKWKPLRPQIDCRHLDASLRILSRQYRFASFEEAVDMVAGRIPVQPYTLALTFDDGYRNNLKFALPILRRYGIPATFFLATGHIEHRKPYWFDRLDFALQHADVARRDFNIGEKVVMFNSNERKELRRAYKVLRDIAKGLVRLDMKMIEELEEMAAVLEAESRQSLSQIFEDDDWSSLLTWDEVRVAAAEGVSFGSHTVDHIRLGLVCDDMVRDQLSKSKEMIEKHSGRPCRYLCYPSGSFSRRVMEIARECGYEAAVTTIPGTNPVTGDSMSLRRIHLPSNERSIEMFAAISGLSSLKTKIMNFTTRTIGRKDGSDPDSWITGD